MIKEGVTESLADFIQGRTPATVGSAHYWNRVQQAKNEYRGIMDKFCFSFDGLGNIDSVYVFM